MHEILKHLQAQSLVLDVGCANGSFSQDSTLATIVRLDRDEPKNVPSGVSFVRADAAALPFADKTFAAVISNHSLEHFEDMQGALREIGRVVDPGGALFVAVPDASTVTDKIYRWLGRGGGHVNAFTSANVVAETIARHTALAHIATRHLYSSLSFLNRRCAPRPLPRRILLLGGGFEWSIFLFVWLSRRLDRRLQLRTSVYGWAFYFGNLKEPVGTEPWVNVCVRCGSASPAAALSQRGLIRSSFWRIRTYHCPQCGAPNPFANDCGE